MLNKHSEEQYLELETNFFNLFNAVQSLLTITEGENLDSDEIKARHLGALSIRLNDISERFGKIKKKVESDMFRGNAKKEKPFISLNENESTKLIECVEHFICMFEMQNEVSDYKNLLNKIKEQ